jgi:hypothetical protein
MLFNEFLKKYTTALKGYFVEYNAAYNILFPNVRDIEQQLRMGPFTAIAIANLLRPSHKYLSHQWIDLKLSAESSKKLQNLIVILLDQYKPELLKAITEIESHLKNKTTVPDNITANLCEALQQISHLTDIDQFISDLKLDANTTDWICNAYQDSCTNLSQYTPQRSVRLG